MYGYESYDGVKNLIDIKPVATLKTKITFLKEVDANESVSYSRRYKTSSKMKIATIPIGYADGLRRELFGKGEVVIKGQEILNKDKKVIGVISKLSNDSFSGLVKKFSNVLYNKWE